jgi:beta-glucosidase
MKQLKPLILLFLLLTITSASYAQNTKTAKMDAYIKALMAKMTLDEKIGQLNLPSIGFDITGPILSQGVEGKIEKGQVGGVFNTYTPDAVRKLQDIAVKKSRLKIPLLFGYDVIHGHRRRWLILPATHAGAECQRVPVKIPGSDRRSPRQWCMVTRVPILQKTIPC